MLDPQKAAVHQSRTDQTGTSRQIAHQAARAVTPTSYCVSLWEHGFPRTATTPRPMCRRTPAGTIDQLIDIACNRPPEGAMPGTDPPLEATRSTNRPATVIEARHIGQGVIDGVECEHLAFRGVDTDSADSIESGAASDPAKIRDHEQDARPPRHNIR